MAWIVRIEQENGSSVGESLLLGEDEIPFDNALPMLSQIAPYYVTLFNPQQMKVFLSELETARGFFTSNEQLEVWRKLHAMATRCVEEQLYLRFLGD